MSDDIDWGDDATDLTERGLSGDPVAIAKAYFIGRDVPATNVDGGERGGKDESIFEGAHAVRIPYDPSIMCRLFEHSNSLRQNVDAYAVNIDGHGHNFEPVIDLEADGAQEEVADAIFLERLVEADPDPNDSEDPGDSLDFPTDAEVDARMEEMEHAMRLEKAKLDAFFRFCCVDDSFIGLRMKTRQDVEVLGNGYWEVLRNGAGEPAQFNYVPGFTMRLLPMDRAFTSTVQKIKRAPLNFEEIEVQRRFRRFIQVYEGVKVYFKEYGDPRVVSSRSGRYYETAEDLQREEDPEKVGAAPPATEILHFAIHSPRSPYGIPRWIGNLLAVLGSRQSEEVNFLYFENKSVPPLAVLVSGGRLSKDSTARIESFVESRLKGRQNFHKIMVIEAVPSSSEVLDNASGRMKLEIVPLTGAQHSDALFQTYDERNIDKVGMSFRLPRLLRGDIRDFNRATADAALEFAETQVFAPERQAFDWAMNRKILTELGIKFWTFASNAPTTRNPLDLAEIVANLVKASILTPEEARDLAKSIFNRDFKKIDELWTKIPPDLLKAGILPDGAPPGEGPPEPPQNPEGGATPPPGEPPAPPPPPGAQPPPQGAQGRDKSRHVLGKRYRQAARTADLRKLAADLLDLRTILRAAEEAESGASFTKARAAEEAESDREVIQIPEEEFRALLGE